MTTIRFGACILAIAVAAAGTSASAMTPAPKATKASHATKQTKVSKKPNSHGAAAHASGVATPPITH